MSAALLAAPSAFATAINGSLSISAAGVVDNGTDLSVRNVYSLVNVQIGIGTGQFTPATPGTVLTTTALDITNVQTFSITGSSFGTFSISAAQAAQDVIISRTAANLDIYLLGTFTPPGSGSLSGYTAGPASLRISFNRTGTGNGECFSIGAGATLASPPATVPEPATLALLGVGILGLGLVRRSRNAG